MTATPKKIRRFEHIGAVMEKILGDIRKSSGHHLIEVCEAWPSAVGPLAAANTKPCAIKGKVLLVSVTGSAWIHELQFLKQEIIQSLNEKLGGERVREIRFKIGPV